MKKIKIATLLFILASYAGKAQVKDISFTLSPAAEYTFWDDKSGLEDNLLVGGKLGFGFGEYLELRGIYMQSLDQKTSFENFGISMFDASLFDAQDVTIKRWGGEFKANLGTKRLMPYFTLGTGVQTFDLKNAGEFEQIYATAGLGFKLNIAKRFVLAIEGKNTTYRFNSGANFLTEANKTDFSVTDADFENERLSNWSVQGSLQFYLGGRKPGTFSELDEAYLKKFKGGFKGLQFIIEPSIAYTTFDDGSLLKDTYWLGGFAGLDFNEYIGIRGFYFQATRENELSTDFDDLSMYGAEFRARLNDGNGVVPFLILGGGYINPSDSYLNKTAVNGINTKPADGGAFATGGLGLNIPLGRHILITGGARAMLTSGDNVTDIANTESIQTSIFYNAGLKFTLGKKSKSPDEVYNNNVDKIISEQQVKNESKLALLKEEYAQKLKALELELKQAQDNEDVDKAIEILEEKKVIEKALQDVKDVEKVQEKQINKTVIKKAKEQEEVIVKKDSVSVAKDSLAPAPVKQMIKKEDDSEIIQMTPAEFESLIERIMKNLDEEEKAATPMPTLNLNPNSVEGNQQNQMKYLDERINVLQKLLLELNENRRSDSTKTEYKALKDENSQKILDRLEELNRKVDFNTNQSINGKSIESADKTIPANKVNTESTVDDENVIETSEVKKEKGDSFITYNNSSVFVGGSFGDLTTANLGIRAHFDIKNTKLQLMPEVFTGFGDETVWGVSANVVYPFSVADGKFKPYFGIGGGLVDFGEIKSMYNVILGTSLPLLDNNLYIDYTMRNTFEQNQIALGYKLKF